MTESTPRITAAYLENFSNQTVRILGKVVQLRGEQATIDSGGQIAVLLNRVRCASDPNPHPNLFLPPSLFFLIFLSSLHSQVYLFSMFPFPRSEPPHSVCDGADERMKDGLAKIFGLRDGDVIC